MTPRLAGWVAAAFLAVAQTPGAVAQATSSGPFVPIGSRLDRLALWAADAGALRGVDPLTRPFRLAALRRAAAAADSATLTATARRSLEWLHQALEAAGDSTSVVAELAVRGYTNGRRETFRFSDSGGVGPAVGFRVGLTRGPFVVVLNPAIDNRLKDDPEYTGYTKRFIAGRMQEAYVAAMGNVASVYYGRFARNWGPPLWDGLLVSPAPYATEALGGALRIGRFELHSFTARLNDVDTSGVVSLQRWFVAHRLSMDLGRGAWLALVETALYGGPGQGFDPVLSAPLNSTLLSDFNDNQGRIGVNAQWGADAVVPLWRGARVAASGFLDDIQVDRDTTLTSRRPTSYGLSVVVTAAMRTAPIHISAGYTRVSSLAYRNSFDPFLEYSQKRVGLGRNFSDYDQVMLRGAWRWSPAWSATLDVSYLRQGAGDFRLPFPSDSALAGGGMGFLMKPVRTAAGMRVTLEGELRPGLVVQGELGAVEMPRGDTRAIAAVGLRLRADLMRRRLGGSIPAVLEGADRGWP
jgi:hypothetical protein